MSGVMLTLGSILFVILLFIIYFSKQRFGSIRNKLYRYMLIVAILLLISEVIAVLFVRHYDNDFINLILYKIHWFTGILWFPLLYYYSICLISNIEAKNIFEIMKLNIRTKIMTIIFIVGGIIYFFVPFEPFNPERISYIPGCAAYYVFGFCAFCVIAIVLYIFKVGNKAKLRTRISVWVMIIELIIILWLQLSFPLIGIEAIGIASQLFFLYFNVENPDLKIIEELGVVKEDIEKSNRAKSDFLSNMSHEIRTPMNAIVGFSEALLNDPNFDEKSVKMDIRHISSAGNNLLDIINNILDISKIESGKEVLQPKEYSLLSIVMELSSIIESRLGDRPVKFIIDVDKDVPSKLYGDSVKLFQVLLNILTNSVKYTEVGKIKLSVTSEITSDAVNLHFKITDTGYGIKKEDYNKLFEKFSRLDAATNNEIEGTGLGLVITKKYVDLMGGKIWFESEYKVGTTFYVDITQKIVNKNAIGDIKEPPKQDDTLEFIDCSKYKVLIVDDNKLNQKVASRLLEPYKFQIELASSGKECIYKVKEGNHYDMIFMDHMMPEMDGIEALHIIKKLEDYELPPIVALTANAITGMKEMYLKEGFDDYLSKPINVSDLNKLIIKYFENISED